MTIQRFGQSFFRIDTQEKVIIAIDPFSQYPESGLTKVPRFRADLILVTHEHPDHNNVAALEGDPLIFRGPGEYEAKGVFIEGIFSYHDDKDGKERGTNTIFIIEAEGLRLVHMGDFGQPRLSPEQEERLGRVDILLIPVGGHYTIGAKTAATIVNEVEPKVVIPMHYKNLGFESPLEGVENFLKELAAKPEPKEKLTVRAKDLEEGKTQVVVLKALSVPTK